MKREFFTVLFLQINHLSLKLYYLCPIKQVFDQDIGQDKRLGIAKLPLIELQAETSKEYELRLLPSLDTLKVKDKKDRGTVTIKVEIVLRLCSCAYFNFCLFLVFL